MPRYVVGVREVHVQPIVIEAPSKHRALDLVEDGQGEPIDDALEYSHTLPRQNWTVEEISPPISSSEDAVTRLQEVGVTAQVQFPNDNGAEFVQLTLPAVEELVKRLRSRQAG